MTFHPLFIVHALMLFNAVRSATIGETEITTTAFRTISTTTSYAATVSCLPTPIPWTLDLHEEFSSSKHDEVDVRPAAKYKNTIAPGRGYVVNRRQGDELAAFYMLVENGHGWKVANCSEEFADGSIERQVCEPYDVSLYYPAPGPSYADTGIIGTTDDLTFPERSPWGIFELNSLIVTPSDGNRSLEGVEMIAVVEAWNVQGQWTGLQTELLTSATPHSEIVIRDAFQGPILKFQVRVHRKARSKLEPLEYFGLILHSLNITEYSYNPNECPYTPPFRLEGPVRMINTSTGPDDNLHLSYADGSLSITATQKLFEPHSLKFKLDTPFTADSITVSISTDDTCTNPASHDSRRFSLNTETGELKFSSDDNLKITKIYEMTVALHPNVSWWLEELVVKEWDELPGCYPCAIDKQGGCKWPAMERSQAHT